MQIILDLFKNFLMLINAMSIYIIIGLLLAGLLKQFISDTFVSKHLGNNSFLSVIKATIFGIPLPICSCSVIPFAQALKKEGASKGAVQSFLISSPITGLDSILATYSIFGIFFTFFRVISSIIIAISVGIIQNFMEKESNNIQKEAKVQNSCGCSSSCSSNDTKKKFSFFNAIKYGFITLLEDMAKSLLIGLIIGSLFITFMPKELTQLIFENQFLTYLIVIIFSIPLYTCATSSLPIAAAFLLQGMSAGGVFIFLTAGPATSSVTISVVYKMLGKTSLIIYLSIITILALLFGFIYDEFFQNLTIFTINKNEDETSLINYVSSFIMLLLIFYNLLKGKFK